MNKDSEKDSSEHNASKKSGQKRFTKDYWDAMSERLEKRGFKNSPELGRNARVTFVMREPRQKNQKPPETD